jgi:hypothetical protein
MQFDTLRECYLDFDTLRECYLDWVSNYNLFAVYADRNGLTVEQAKALIQLGRECYETYCNLMKES